MKFPIACSIVICNSVDNGGFHMCVKSDSYLLWICFTVRHVIDVVIGVKKLALLCHPIRSEAKTNRDSFAHFSRALRQLHLYDLSFWLAKEFALVFVLWHTVDNRSNSSKNNNTNWEEVVFSEVVLNCSVILVVSEYAKVQQHLNLWLSHARSRSRCDTGNGFHFSWWSRVLQNRWIKLGWTATQM